ncbi:MAG: hypothetical protein V7L20_11085 [Nostoc sp.]|uniref:hypothetical protein n=1 Tax=Nostoc sp. TaxID=1180 RepID=UPI002FF91F98
MSNVREALSLLKQSRDWLYVRMHLGFAIQQTRAVLGKKLVLVRVIKKHQGKSQNFLVCLPCYPSSVIFREGER